VTVTVTVSEVHRNAQAMAIFGKKKKPTPTTTAPPLQSQSAPAFIPQYDQPSPYAITSQPNWSYVEQRPNTSYGYGSPPQQPQGWLVAPVPAQYQPVFVTPEYSTPPPLPLGINKSSANVSKFKLSSVTNLLAGDVPECIPGARIFNDGVTPLYMQGTQYLNQSAALCDLISSKFDAVITLIDGERFSGDERELAVLPPTQPMWQQQQETGYTNRDMPRGKSKGMVNNSVSSALTSTNYFAKVNLYANARLPPNFPPLKL